MSLPSFRAGLFIVGFCWCFQGYSQNVERVFRSNIHTAQLFRAGDQQSLPIYTLNSGERLQLEFDDAEADVKSYYTFVLCDYNWHEVDLSPFDYIKGFTQNRIITYRYSSIALTRYTHYEAFLPDRNSTPLRSGNYLLKVFLDGDTSKLVFTKQMLVADSKATISGAVTQPFSAQLFNSHQKIKMSVNLGSINSFSAAQQVKVVILQNNRWDIAQRDIPPTFVRANMLEYNTEEYGLFPGGKEWRWLDLRSFHLQSDRIDSAAYHKTATDMYVKADIDRRGQRYLYFPDYDGMYNIISYESLNPFWQGDYATVHFNFAPPDGNAYPKRNLYLAGGFTGYQLSDEWKMRFNAETGRYEANAFLKQGYYNYTYISVDENDFSDRIELEGNYWETENTYTILVYYKSFTDRTDQLLGTATINSRRDRPGFGF